MSPDEAWEPVGTLPHEWRGFVIPAVIHAAQHMRTVAVAGGRALDQPVYPADLPDGTYTLVWDRESKVVRLLRVTARPAQPAVATTARASREQEALESNRSLGVPVEWLPDYHFRPDGATGSGWGNRVYHVRLREDLTEGRLRRERGDWLCKPSRRRHQELFSIQDREEEHGTEEDELLSLAPVTCKACLRMCQRWSTTPQRKD